MATAVARNQGGHPQGGSSSSAKGATTKPVALTTDTWSRLLLEVLNQRLRATGQKLIPLTQNNINNIERIMATEVAGQQGGFLRDNNPLNTGTYATPHSGLYGGHTVQEYGIYINKFSTPLAGAQGTARYLEQYGANMIRALQQNAPTSIFAASSPWWKVGATPLKETAQGTTTPADLGQFAAGLGGGSTLTKAQQAIVSAYVKAARDGTQIPAKMAQAFSALSAATKQQVTNAIAAALASGSGVPASSPAGTVTSGLSSLASDFSGLGSILKDLGSSTWWKRVGIFAGGAALLVGGVAVFLSTTKPVQGAAKTAAGLIP